MHLTFNRDQSDLSYETDYKADLNLGAVQAQLSRLLRSIDMVGWSRREESGRLDRRSLSRFAVGDKSLFSRREYTEAEKAAVSVLVDCSGSMFPCAKDSQLATIQLCKLLDKAKVSFNVTGFSGTNKYGIINERIVADAFQSVKFLPFKRWEESLRKSKTKLGTLSSCTVGSTPEFGGLKLTIEDLAKRPESRKILFMITDADGFEPSQIEYLERLADRLGVVIAAVGLDSPDVPKVFRHGVNIQSASKLGEAAVQSLLRNIR
jgi:cobalamin biosynthesis protein CobT